MSRKVLSNVAYKAIKERISKMPSGSYLSARQCALELDISYTPVREAFLRLQKEGILRQVPNVGFFIQSVDLTDIFQIFQVRECIEIFALEKVIGKLKDTHFSKMQKLCEEEEISRQKEDSYRYAELDAAFHRIPLELLGNKHILLMYDNVRAQYQIISGQLLPLIDDDIQREHWQFIEASKKCNVQAAREILLHHIQETKQRIINNYIHDNLE